MTTYSTITDKTQDEPFGIDEHNALNDNTKALYERQVRGGTDATGVRMAVARGRVTWTSTLSSGYVTVSGSVTFSTGSDDGDPAFTAAPIVMFALEEETTGGTDWNSNDYQLTPYVVDGTLATSGFSWEINIVDHSSTSNNVYGYLHWIAIGAV